MRIGIDIDGVLTNVEEFEIDYGSKYFYETGMFENVIKNIDFNKENYNINAMLVIAFGLKQYMTI